MGLPLGAVLHKGFEQEVFERWWVDKLQNRSQ